MSRWAAILPLLALALLVALFARFSLRHSPQVTPMAMVGKLAPDPVLRPLNGGSPKPLRAAAQRGPILINFFASWCAPCAAEAPALMALKAEGVPIVAVDYKDHPADASDFLARYGDPYEAVFADPQGRVGIDFGITGVPETFVVDAAGVIRGKEAQPISAADAEGLLQKAER
ncbi:MAG TPA: DsbE family thiol:disulfide interchange protein [Caulobacteraceae bacterium]|nr:DsbE family thiol:disulfide interchange protein [Caulobacteraceae bacterium]